MEKFKKTNIIVGCISAVSAVGIALSMTFWYLINVLPERAYGLWPAFVNLMMYIMAYLSSFFFLLSLIYFIAMFIYSIVLLFPFASKEKKVNEVKCEQKEVKQ